MNQGYGGRRARGVGIRTRGEATVRLPLSPRTLCAPGSGSAPGSGAHAATHVHPPATPREHHATPASTAGEDVAALPDEPMLNVERPESGTWICCVPCFWLRRSKAVHKALLTFAMLLVTSLLVTSPVLFLITTLPEGEQPLDCAPMVSFFLYTSSEVEELSLVASTILISHKKILNQVSYEEEHPSTFSCDHTYSFQFQ